MLYEAKGTVKRVLEKQQFASGFCKRNLIVEVGDKYKKTVSFEFKKDKADLLEKIRPGMAVVVKFDIDGREWNDPKTGATKYFTSLEGVSVKGEGGAGRATPPPAEPPSGFDDMPDAGDMPF